MPTDKISLIQPESPLPYPQALKLQRSLLAERQKEERPDTLLLLEHPPTVTLGRNADTAGVMIPTESLEAKGFHVERIARGGEVTYHGPGQIVGYPIIKLRPRKWGVKHYVEQLEEVMLQAVLKMGGEPFRVAGRQGIFCPQGKLGAVGVAVSGGVTWHGFALNICPDLSHYQFIVPCGLTDVTPTSLNEVLANPPELSTAYAAIKASLAMVFNCQYHTETYEGNHSAEE